jgi:membrane-associated phospholipid phosphatase
LKRFVFRWLAMPVIGLSFAVTANPAFSQISKAAFPNLNLQPFEAQGLNQPGFVTALADFPDQSAPASTQPGDSARQGFLIRNLKRGLEDQKQLWSAPFRRKNLKWDALFLLTTGAILATDRQASRAVPKDHVNISHDVALLCIIGTGAGAGLTWLHGIRADDSHAKETGYLTLESLANTFLIYTPMQLIAGRERPDDATGNGRFWQNRSVNTSFPAGHPMFMWAMSSVIAHEYPKRWVKILAYGTAFSVSAGRFTGRNHFPSDIFVGSMLGYLIGTHIFHARCNEDFSDACHR